MINSYDKMYLHDAKRHLAIAMDYCINICGLDPEDFTFMFINSGLAKQIEDGNPGIISGKSGIELGREIILKNTNEYVSIDYQPSLNRTPEFWAGWVLAEYQWYTARTFENILERIPLIDIIYMYNPYHEMDIMNFIEEMNRRFTSIKDETKLKKMRTYNSLSQSELAAKSGVSKRIIQLYEQRVNDINKAAAHTVYKLARALHCTVEELLEDPMFTK